MLGLDRDIISITVAMLTDYGLWVDTWKRCGSHWFISAVAADPLRKRRLLSTFSVSGRPLLGAQTDSLALRFLAAWWNYHLLSSRIYLHLSNLLAGFSAWSWSCLWWAALTLTNFFLFPGFRSELLPGNWFCGTWSAQELRSPAVLQQGPLCMLKWA